MPRLAGWEIGRVPGFYRGMGAPGASTLEPGDYLVGDYYDNLSASTSYRCTTAGSASTSVWTQFGGASGTSVTIWARIATHTSGVNETSFVFSSLAGDTDVEYMLIARWIANGGSNILGVQFNADAGANYGHNSLYENTPTAVNSETGSGETLAKVVGFINTTGKTGTVNAMIYAVSGQLRYIQSAWGDNDSTLGVGATTTWWTNTVSAITSITVLSTVASGIGTGSYFELWAQRAVHVVSVP